MQTFTERLLRCTRQLCEREAALLRLLESYESVVVEPAAVTTEISLDEYPAPAEPQWDRDRDFIFERAYEECGEDLSSVLTYQTYMTARTRGRLLVTSVVDGMEAGRISVVPVSLEEIESRGDWAVMLFACGNMAAMRETPWLVRIVRERMADDWTGFMFLAQIAFIDTIVTSDGSAIPKGYLSAADAFRSQDEKTSRVALKVMTAETNRRLLLRLFPRLVLGEIPQGLVHNNQAISAYKDLVLDEIAARIGLPAHAEEARLREIVVSEATLTQCVGIQRLPSMLAQMLYSP